MTSRSSRALRGAAASAVATTLAAVSHTVGGAAAPEPLLVVVMAALVAPIAMLLVGRRLRLAAVSLTVLVAQLLFHTVFLTMDAGFASAPGGMAGDDLHGHVHGAAVAMTHIAASTALPGAPMLAAHVLAALATVALLHRGETALLAVAQWVAVLLARATDAVAAPETATAPPSDFRAIPPHDRTRTWAIARRGPPLLRHGA